MKRLSMFALVGILGLSTFSCLNNDDSDFVNYGYFTTEGVTVNQDSIMPINQTTNVKVNYSKTNSCQFLYYLYLSSCTFQILLL